MSVLEAQHLYKIFGRRPDEVVKRLEEGADAAELREKYGVTPAVIDASFEVQQGEIFVVMGLSGSGKSTLIRMLNGLHPASSGKVLIHGEDISAMGGAQLRKTRSEHISMVFQHFALFPHRTVLQNAAYGLKIKGMRESERNEKAREALSMVGLDGWTDQRPGELSGGMQQRVGLARALAAGTDIMLMDEAFSALDPLIRRDMQDQLIELQQKLGKTIVFITHDLNEAMRIGDRIAMMRNGRIVQIGTAEQILTDPANDYVAQFIADVDRTRVLTAGSIMEPPVATLGIGNGPKAAQKLMREHQQRGLYVVSRDRTLQGYVMEEAVAANRELQTIESLVQPIDTAVSVDEQAAHLFTPSASVRLPLPVVDADNKLRGVIPRVTLLAALGQVDAHETGVRDTDDAPKPQAGGNPPSGNTANDLLTKTTAGEDQ
ncbi:glycine/betaine ABC transporter ATP-binding protein [Flexivirga endophytica]|uniref:Glycine/betaine ABC transporter ATP-binding protein n=1 Tax=Flexivirga endophytica TaxID=1849103 RepID=A0A916SY65_9MICO|nr:glycine betaine/L-proline ABC transporter ATP-binding protein [Flexivirga endophytica]GGB19676.1 glycine/betaine ABC transporter ATP-binding protein [Flexivirga endophytica]GHB36018.1 glycine/betaine ABC transporter ATP-binding protein [Flexivirga endophytica]